MDYNEVMSILVVHFIADFIFQSDKMALNKSKSFKWLTIHIAVYTFVISCFFIFFFDGSLKSFFLLVGINAAAHWVTDYFSSRVSSYFWNVKKNRHVFFVVVGLDQLLHYYVLFYSWTTLSFR